MLHPIVQSIALPTRPRRGSPPESLLALTADADAVLFGIEAPIQAARKLLGAGRTDQNETVTLMDHATLSRIATLPAEDRAIAIDDLVEVLVRRGLTEDELDRLERRVHQVNAALAQARRPN